MPSYPQLTRVLQDGAPFPFRCFGAQPKSWVSGWTREYLWLIELVDHPQPASRSSIERCLLNAMQRCDAVDYTTVGWDGDTLKLEVSVEQTEGPIRCGRPPAEQIARLFAAVLDALVQLHHWFAPIDEVIFANLLEVEDDDAWTAWSRNQAGAGSVTYQRPALGEHEERAWAALAHYREDPASAEATAVALCYDLADTGVVDVLGPLFDRLSASETDQAVTALIGCVHLERTGAMARAALAGSCHPNAGKRLLEALRRAVELGEASRFAGLMLAAGQNAITDAIPILYRYYDETEGVYQQQDAALGMAAFDDHDLSATVREWMTNPELDFGTAVDGVLGATSPEGGYRVLRRFIDQATESEVAAQRARSVLCQLGSWADSGGTLDPRWTDLALEALDRFEYAASSLHQIIAASDRDDCGPALAAWTNEHGDAANQYLIRTLARCGDPASLGLLRQLLQGPPRLAARAAAALAARADSPPQLLATALREASAGAQSDWEIELVGDALLLLPRELAAETVVAMRDKWARRQLDTPNQKRERSTIVVMLDDLHLRLAGSICRDSI